MLLWRVVFVDLKDKVRTDLRTGFATCATGQELGIAVAPGVDFDIGHDEDARRTGIDAEIAPFTGIDIDDESSSGRDRFFVAHAPSPEAVQAGTEIPGTALNPVVNAASFNARCWAR